MDLLSAFKYRSFALLWFGQTTSRFGDRVHQVAIAWLVVQLTHSALAMGSVLTAELLPTLALLLLGGVVADGVPRIAILLASDVLRALIVFAIALLVVSSAIVIGHVIALAVLFGVVSAFFQPAYAALVPEIVGADDRSSANSLMALGSRAAGVGGPLVAAVLMSQGGVASALAIDALTYLMSAGALVLVARRRRATATVIERAERKRSVGSEFVAGVRVVTATRWIGWTILIAGITNVTLAGPIEGVFPQLVERHLGGSVETYGGLTAVMSTGAVAGALFVGRRRHLRRRGPLLYGAWIMLALSTAVLGSPVGIPGAAVAVFLIGAGETVLGLVWTHALQEFVRGDQLGRVSSIDALGSYALIPVGYAIAGGAADALGPAVVFAVGGAISAILLGLVALQPSIRGLD